MKNLEDNRLDILLIHLKQFLEGNIFSLSQTNRKDPFIFHYYNEIVRFWSKLNFIIKYTLLASKIDNIKDKLDVAKLLFLTYRTIWEKASIKSLMNEIAQTKNVLKLREFRKYLSKLQTFSLKKALKNKSPIEKLSIYESIPSFVINRLLPVMTLEFLKDNIRFFNSRNENANISLRMNTLNYSIRDEDFFKKISKLIFDSGIKVRQDAHFPELIHIPFKFRGQILKSRRYNSGDLIFQDKASSAIVHTLAPQPGELICDMCAAPGIKTSLIAQFTRNKAKIISGEFLPKRAKEMKNLLKVLHVLNYNTIITDSGRFPTNLYNQFDRVLLDAPCTGSGTFLANPELKLRQNETFLHQNLVIQEALLENAVKLLKPKGTLVYSTCSLYPEEGELQVLNQLNELEPIKIPNFFSPSYEINKSTIYGTGRLFPAIHQTQGFFVGKFKKKEI